jgi:DNA-binding PadR family transcriptional regulator
MSEKRDWPTKAEMLVLHLLQQETGGMYGLEIVEASKSAKTEISRGSVYVLLGRLEIKGFVKSSVPKTPMNHPGLPRRTYKLTADGMRVLSAAEDLGLAAGV